MSEEQEKKPKTTLIKHKKTSPPSEKENKGDKKKVVVVKKKKVVVVKKPSAKEDPKATERDKLKQEEVKAGEPDTTKAAPAAPKETPKQKAPEKQENQSSQTTRGREERKVPKDDKREKPDRFKKDVGGTAAKDRSRQRKDFQGKEYPRTESRGKSTSFRGKPSQRGDSQTAGDRKKSFTKPGERYEQSRTAPPGQEEKKASGKRFKTKKKGQYPKSKKEEHEEKYIPLKKKQPKKTNPVPKEIDIMEVITVSELAKKMNLKASDLIGKLMSMGVMATINQQIDADTAALIAEEYGCKVNIVSLYDETIIESEEDNSEHVQHRPPIVTVMGHVDHGKTKLLDAIRSSDVVGSEHGGITQHIGAYVVENEKGQIVFLDTPGHEAFTTMRSRGAQVTDLVILVVAANDGVMPQTVEAINHAKEAKVPIIVAVNKVDLPEANPDRVKQQLSEYDLIPEDWGGSTLFCSISALKRTGLEDLIETVLLQSEMLELEADYSCRAEGHVIESKVDHGRGIVSTVLVQRGTLHVGDAFIAGIYPGKIRAMFNDKGQKVDMATPSMPVEILGFTGIPQSGDPFQVTENEKYARQVGAKRQELKKVENAANVKKVTLDNLYDSIQDGEIQELKVVIKGDVYGSVEALQSALEKLSTSSIRLNVIHASAGAINERDVMLASASNAIIIGFHVRPTPNALTYAEQERVEIRKYNVIYDVVNDIKSAMEGLLEPDYEEETIGEAEVRDVFKVPKIGLVAGCFVTSGKVKRGVKAHVIRDDVVVHTGTISSLKRFKDDVREVESNYECGIGIDGLTDVKVGDRFEVFEMKEIAKSLDES